MSGREQTRRVSSRSFAGLLGCQCPRRTPASPTHRCHPVAHRPRGKPGRPRKRPAKRHTDKAYDSSDLRRALRARGITPRIARRGIDSRERLGRHHWVVERTLFWLLGCRRLGVRYERRADLLQGLLHLACVTFLRSQQVSP